MADKKNFDIKTGEMKRIEASVLSNPLLASYTTSFTRSLVSECLHNISLLRGRVVSVTTDGFITDIPCLEERILEMESGNTLLKLFKSIRCDLTGGEDMTALELKKTCKGIISWTTRGQLSLDSKIKATTGFQSSGVEHSVMISDFEEALSKPDKSLVYIQSSLTGSREIYKNNGNVTLMHKDQSFSLTYDNRREIIVNDAYNDNGTGPFKTKDVNNACLRLLDSVPLSDKKECLNLRKIASLSKNKYDKTTHLTNNTKYKSMLDIAIRVFIRGYLSDPPKFGLLVNDFDGYDDIIKFVKSFDTSKKSLTKQSISNLKKRNTVNRAVPRSKETMAFTEHVKKRFPLFNGESFLKG